MPNLTRCRRCGICLGACPERIISFKDYSVDIVSSMIKAVEIPDEFEEKPRLLGLLCENDAYPALDVAGLQRIQHSAFIRFIPVRCLGAVNIVWIADALSRGFDGILLVGCKSGDDYQCHFVRGSELMGTRGDNIREKLTAARPGRRARPGRAARDLGVPEAAADHQRVRGTDRRNRNEPVQRILDGVSPECQTPIS